MKLYISLIILFCSTLAFSAIPHKTGSVLAEGSWYKIAVTKNGIHRITYDDFKNMGIDMTALNTATIRVFGNGGAMLPENNAGYRYDDLRENAISVHDGGDGKLDPGDYILFFGEAPDHWNYNYTSHLYSHLKNLYSDSSCYFINTGLAEGKRVTPGIPDTVANTYSRRFDDFIFYEKDSLNLIKSGRIWYGEVFNDKRSSYGFHFSFPNIDSLSPVRILTSVAARSAIPSKFYIEWKGKKQDSIQVDFLDLQSTSVFARPKQKVTNLMLSKENIDLTLSYAIPDGNSTGWLDYFELICARYLRWTAPQMTFRDANTIGKNNVTEFTMTAAGEGINIWDVTDRENISRITPVLSGNDLKFIVPTDTLREFVAFDGSMFYPVRLVGPVANQNLHALDSKDLVIVTHPLFKDKADSLAAFHRTTNGLSVIVATTTEIYNEFGSGNSDLSAIRDFMKMLYDRGLPSGTQPRYLLLFGDGSYDPKARVPNNNNMVPTYQSVESLKFIGTYVTDDYFGIMGDNQGEGSNGTINIGIGRFPVTVPSDASILLKKIIKYSSRNDSILSDWRNIITFIADDENRNLHTKQAEELAGIVKTKYPVFNVDKIYLDAYQMVQVPAGFRFPEVNKAINHAVAKGSLIVNYTGHGGEDGWAAEKVLTIADIKSWQNADKLPVFITATCEFSRFDNPERFTAGEMVLMQPNGGAIALYSTTRLALSTSNFRLDSSFFENLLPEDGGPIPKMGDLIKISKNNNTNNNNIRNFVLLGDPAQEIAFPRYNVTTTEINNHPVGTEPDTLQGLSLVTVKGQVVDITGNKAEGFSGLIYPKVFDKPTVERTLGNTDDSYPQDFELQKSLLYKGQAAVTNGEFGFSFKIPLSISLQYGKGKLSYYTKDAVTDGNGYYDNIIIGGQDPSVNPVNPGPELALYMDSTNFVNGGKTGQAPVFLSYLNDADGINYTDVGIGHEIIAILDNDVTHPIVLNDFYCPEVNSFEGGIVRYPMQDLANGRHSIRLKAWDSFNNSSENEIYFFISEYPEVSVSQLINYPNPVEDHTLFSFTPMQNAGSLNALLTVYNQTGQPVRTIEKNFPESSQGVLTIPWNGTGDNGALLSNGLYIYRLTVKGSNGAFFQASQKLVMGN